MKGPAERPLHVASPARRRHILRSASAKYVRCGDFVDALIRASCDARIFMSQARFPSYSPPQFEQWSRYAVRLRDKAESDEIELDDYLREIMV